MMLSAAPAADRPDADRFPALHTTITSRSDHATGFPSDVVAAAVRRIDPVPPLADALAALGLGRTARLRWSVPAPGVSRAAILTAAWAMAGGRRAQACWTVTVEPAQEGGSWLAADVKVGAEGPAGELAVREAWPLLGPLVDTLTRRLLASVVELADQAEDDPTLTARHR